MEELRLPLAYGLIGLYFGGWLLLRAALPFRQFPFFWVFYFATIGFDVLAGPQLVAEGWFHDGYAGSLGILWLGFMILGGYFAKGRSAFAMHYRPATQVSIRQTRLELVFILGISILLIGFWTVTQGPPLSFRLLSLGNASGTDLITLRQDLQFGDSKYHWFKPGFHMLPILAAMAAYAVVLRRPTFLSKAIFWGALLYSLVTVTAFLNKDGVIIILIGLLMVRALLGEGLTPWRLGISLVLGLLAVIGLYIVYDPEFLTTGGGLDLIWDRMGVAYARAGGIVFDRWGIDQPFHMGATIVNPGGILPYENVPLSQLIYPYHYLGDFAGNAPAPAFAEGYANFGWPGVVGAMLLSFALIAFLQRFFARLRYSGLEIGLLVLLLYETTQLGANSLFYTVLHPTNTLFYIALLSAIWAMRSSRRTMQPVSGVHPAGSPA